ncbi:hypothetical protein JMJ77_0003842 [Colletotrichum scovillei]|uniref:Uncharacterized protein n=1 Tax=Colletotrichum scovillei TaxID=1209932 RepID=A0A9P7U8I6_9PEZI|nr:hypothetical protein JMJ77_0003842 [Colletotrichum scovillei]KAG7049090.1 hypothetical protein JMJ78_0013073 [Colletotrichum scovillei]KAG7063832.1 hypothetical protein JMJ76_0006880 [Colletotrichum scovillei]
MYSVPNGRHPNTPRDKVPPSLRTDICAHAHVPHVPHVPSWNPRTRPVAPSSVLPFPSQTHDRFSFRPSPFLFLPVPLPPAYPFLQQSSSYLPLLLEILASQPPIAYSRARLLAQLICNIATANHPPSSLAYITLSPPIPPPPGTFVSHHPRNSSRLRLSAPCDRPNPAYRAVYLGSRAIPHSNNCLCLHRRRFAPGAEHTTTFRCWLCADTWCDRIPHQSFYPAGELSCRNRPETPFSTATLRDTICDTQQCRPTRPSHSQSCSEDPAFKPNAIASHSRIAEKKFAVFDLK